MCFEQKDLTPLVLSGDAAFLSVLLRMLPLEVSYVEFKAVHSVTHSACHSLSLWFHTFSPCVQHGMLQCRFNKQNKMVAAEMMFDVMGFMQQLQVIDL